MANAVNYLAQIQTGQTIQAVHVSQFVDAFTGSVAYDLRTSGSFTIIGPLTATASAASTVYIASNNGTNNEYNLVFKNSGAGLNDYHQLGADETNGPYYNPATNVLGGVGGMTVSGSIGRFNSITGSFLGNINGSSSYSTTASYALTSSYASNGVTNLSVGAFSDRTTQAVSSSMSASLVFNTTDLSDGITLGIAPNNSRMIVTKTGTYNIQFSIQLALVTGAGGSAHIWLRKNGVNEDYSAGAIYLQNTQEKNIAAWNYVTNLIAGDYVELVLWAQGADIQALAEVPIPGTGPTGNGNVGVPSIIATMTQIK